MKIPKFFQKQTEAPSGAAVNTPRIVSDGMKLFGEIPPERAEFGLYEALRNAVPVIDAAINKTVRLTGGFRVISSDESIQDELDEFVLNVKSGPSSQSLSSFIDCYLDSLLTYGSAAGEIIVDTESMEIAGIYNVSLKHIEARRGTTPVETEFYRRSGNNALALVKNPQLILFSALNPQPEKVYGNSVLKGLPYLSSILMRIYESIGQNFDRVGNVRYAVTYKPQDSGDRAFAKERAAQIAKEWSEGMQASKCGQIRDFVAVGDVEIKTIGADNQVIDTNIPVKQLLEQIIAKLSIPPFLLGLSWSTTERMSAQQADILTSELEYYRRLLTPTIVKICSAFLRLKGSDASVTVEWDNINLQDEAELADARLKNAQAAEIEEKIKNQN